MHSKIALSLAAGFAAVDAYATGAGVCSTTIPDKTMGAAQSTDNQNWQIAVTGGSPLTEKGLQMSIYAKDTTTQYNGVQLFITNSKGERVGKFLTPPEGFKYNGRCDVETQGITHSSKALKTQKADVFSATFPCDESHTIQGHVYVAAEKTFYPVKETTTDFKCSSGNVAQISLGLLPALLLALGW